MSTAVLQELLDRGVADGVFPAAQAVVVRGGQTVFSGAAGDANASTVFDLASLTKVLCTTPLFLALWGEGKVGPHTPLARLLPQSRFAAAGATLADLLLHRSGLPGFVPFFAHVLPTHPELLEAGCSPQTRQRVRDEVVTLAMNTAPEAPRGVRAVYSDVGFILLGEALAQAGGAPLEQLFAQKVAAPLGLASHFRPLSRANATEPLAPTGTTRPREPAPGQEGMWPALPSAPSRPGEVDDDNAWVMDGVAGHAGLFGTAEDVARFGQRVLEELGGAGRLAPAPLWQAALRRDAQTPGSTRVMGFDTPSDEGSVAGSKLGKRPPGAIGHTGFTGTTLYVDLARELVVALVTNRTLPGRANVRIKEFRPRFHDAAVDATGG